MNKYVPAEVVAEHFGVSVVTVRSWVSRNTIPPTLYLKLGGRYSFDLEGMRDYWTKKTHDAYNKRARVHGTADEIESNEPEVEDFVNLDEDM